MLVTIRSHLLLLVLAILVPALAGASWLVISTIAAERAASERTLRDTARALSMLVDRELSQRIVLARVLAQSRWLEAGDDMSPTALLRFGHVARQSLQGSESWLELRSAHRVLLDTRLPPGALPKLPGLQEHLSLSDKPGVQSRAGGSRARHAAIIEPVLRDGKLLLNLVIALPSSELQHIIDSQSLSADAVGAVLDKQGEVIAHHLGGISIGNGRSAADLKAQLALRHEGLFETVSDEGEPSMAYFSTSPQGWTYVSGITRERYNGLFSQTVQRVLLGALILLLIAGVGALLISRRVVAPVMALKTAAGRMQAGLPVAHQPTGIAECDAVGHALADASDAIQDSRKQLERQVTEAVARTRLAEQRVSHSQRVGALGRLTGGVAHDFNNLLGIISNSAHLIQRHPAAAELQAPIATLLRAVESGSQMTQHLLRFAGRRPVRPQTVELSRYLPELQPLLRSVLGRQTEIWVQVEPHTAAIRVDPGELELTLINLGLNARDAMPGGGELRLQARNAQPQETEDLPPLIPPRPWVLLAVSDDGVGISPELINRVFEPFFTTKAPVRGAGLGLAQVHGFCAQAGGVARLASTPGLGTTVSLLLPASLEADAASTASEKAPSGAHLPSVGGLRLLVVEDNEELGDATTALLRSHGARVTRAHDAAGALALLQAGSPFDVVLSDVVMPGEMDGHALACWIRDHLPQLPVVLISGYHTVPPNSPFRVLGKPCPPDELLAALRDAASGPRGG